MDSAFGVHPDFESHAGATMTFEGGKGLVINVSAKAEIEHREFNNSSISGSGLHIAFGTVGAIVSGRTGTQLAGECDKSR